MHHVDRLSQVLFECIDRPARRIGAGAGAYVAEETRVDYLDAATERVDCATFRNGFMSGGAVAESQVLHGGLRVFLVVAVSGGPNLFLIAGVHVKNAPLSLTAQRDLSAAI